jgi:hypothetical protein
MQQLFINKCNTIRAAMRPTAAETHLTDKMKEVVLKLVTSLDTHVSSEKGDSETQKSSARTEREVMNMIGVPQITKTKKKAKNLSSVPSLVGDYYGIKRTVEHRNECRFVMPEVDGVYAIHQPYGSQANPDILLLDVRDKKIMCQFGVEIKSGGPTWNTHIQFADRGMMYIAFKKKSHYFFGEHVRSKESLILALAWDELQRELAAVINVDAKSKNLTNLCVSYPKQEFHGLNLDTVRDERHSEIKEWLRSSPVLSELQTAQEQHSQPV